jgi:predicted NBD/HSP70 family sugar kinase
MKLFVGLDVSLEKTAICVISEHGKIVKEPQAASEPEALLRWISDQDGTIAEPHRVCRRLIFVSYAAMSSVSRAA